MRFHRALLASFAFAALCAAPATRPAAAQALPGDSARQQIALLQAEKAGRSPALRKVDSRLTLELRWRSDSAFAAALPQLRGGAPVRADGLVLADLRANFDARGLDSLRAHIEDLGGRVVSAHDRFGRLRAWLLLERIEEIAARPEVRWIRPADQALTQMINTSEGDVAHAADTTRTDFGIDGTGVTACAMSDSVDALATVQGSGDLPGSVTVLPGQSGNPGTSEGTALLEILHDLAPGAELAFATGKGGEAQMAQNILDLQTLGCNVIVDDILYFAEPVFQDGIIAEAVTDVVAAGTVYLTSAGNSGNLNAGTAGVFEGDYVAGTLPAALTGAGLSAHDFLAGDVANEVTDDSPFFFTLQWADPSDGATNDYDLFLLDATLANVLGASTSTQNGTQDPFEIIDTQAGDDTGNQLVVVLFSGSARHLHLNGHRGRLEYATDGQIFGHPGAQAAITIAAVNVATAGGGVFTGGPVNPVEFFSSDGPRRIYFDPNGTPVNPLGAGEGVPGFVERDKPDFTAADGVSTATPGFNPFFGTSAAAPHAAALATLLKDLIPGLTPQGVYGLFSQSALDIEALGFDRDSGFGIPNLPEAADSLIFTDGFESGNTSAWTNSTP